MYHSVTVVNNNEKSTKSGANIKKERMIVMVAEFEARSLAVLKIHGFNLGMGKKKDCFFSPIIFKL
jgi:hypothetical protein